jgi:hypothetical protein
VRSALCVWIGTRQETLDRIVQPVLGETITYCDRGGGLADYIGRNEHGI